MRERKREREIKREREKERKNNVGSGLSSFSLPDLLGSVNR